MSKAFGTNPRNKKNTPAAGTTSKRKGPMNKRELEEAARQEEAANQAAWAAEDAAEAAGAAAGDAAAEAPAAENSTAATQEAVASTPEIGNTPQTAPESPAPNTPAPGRKRTAMQTITATLAPKQRKSKNIVMFNLGDRKNAIQLPKTLFGDSLPEGFSIQLVGEFAEPKVREPRKKLTKEERAARPKPTLAERAAKAEERAAKLRAKLAEAEKAAEQPAAESL